MKLLVLVALVAAASAAPQPKGDRPSRQAQAQAVQLTRFEFDNTGAGYRYAYEQTDGQKKEEQGEFRNRGSENEYLAVKGSYTWFSPEGIQYIVTYVADDNGYQPNVEQGPGVSSAALASILGAG